MPDLILNWACHEMENHKVKVGSFGYLKVRLNYFLVNFNFTNTIPGRILDNASRQAWSLSFCHNRLGSQSPHALLDQIQDTERMPVPIGVSFFKRFCCLALPGAPNCEPCFGVAVWPRFVCPLNVLS